MRRLTTVALALALWPSVAEAVTQPTVRERAAPVAAAHSHVVRSPARFNLAAFRWQGSGTLHFRVKDRAGIWGAWRSLDGESAGGEVASSELWRVADPIWTGPAVAIAYRSHGDVRKLRIAFIWSEPQENAPYRLHLAGTPAIITRAAWGADETIRRHTPTYAPALELAIIHHTAGSNSYTKAESAAIVRGIYAYHVRSLGWNDLGYSFLVDKYGQVFEGRSGGLDRAVIGAHALGFNTGSVGIALVGNYSTAALPQAGRRALVALLAWRLDVAHLDPLATVTFSSRGNSRYPKGKQVKLPTIVGHRDTGPTECPGTRLYPELHSIAQEVSATGGPKLFDPKASGSIGAPIRFSARLSASLPWTVTISSDGETVAAGSGTGSVIDWIWDATGADPARTYEWSITAGSNVLPASGTLGATVAERPTMSEFRLSSAVLTPNGDGVTDTLKLHYRLAASATVELSLFDESGQLVVTLVSENQAAGVHDLDLALDAVVNGRYKLTLSARNLSGEGEASWGIAVTRTLSFLAVTPKVLTPNGDGLNDVLWVTYALAGEATVELRILRNGEAISSSVIGTQSSGPQSYRWDASVDGVTAPDGAYQLELAVTDTVTTTRQRIAFVVDNDRPRVKLLSRQPLRLWLSEPARVILYVNGRRQERTVAAAGSVTFSSTKRVRTIRAVAIDAAGNRSAVLRR